MGTPELRGGIDTSDGRWECGNEAIGYIKLYRTLRIAILLPRC